MFNGVPEALTSQGHRVERTLVQGDGTLSRLAERLWQQLETFQPPFVLLCHSMGGLQARTFLLDDERARHINAIATVGSPHAGTALAQAAFFGQAYRDLRPSARRVWNDAHEEAERQSAERHGIRLLSAVAATRSPRHLPFRVTVPLLNRLVGPNDGLVPAASQRFGTHAFDVALDHISCSATSGSPDELRLWSQLADVATAADFPRVTLISSP